MTKFPSEFIDIAKQHGESRAKLCEQIRKTNTKYHSDNPTQFDFVGVLGELLAQYSLQKKGLAFCCNALVDEKPITDFDVYLKKENKKFYIDVKAATQPIFKVPVHKHKKAMERTKINYYWFFYIRINDRTFIDKLIPAKKVEHWSVQEFYQTKVKFYTHKL